MLEVVPEEIERDLLNILGGIVIGALSIIIWDMVRYGREAARRDQAGINAVTHSLNDNQEICQENIKALRSELSYLERDRIVVEPVLKHDRTLWQLIRLQLPHKIATNTRLLSGISYIFQRLGHINRLIASRETYRQANTSDADYIRRMTKYDQSLIADTESLWQSLFEYEQVLYEEKSLKQIFIRFLRRMFGTNNQT